MQLTISGQTSSGSSTATGLQTATTVVSISTSPAPIVGQVLVATSNVSATWQTSAGTSSVPTGGAGDQVFYENANVVTANYTITSGKNAMSAGPITINSNVIVTVPTGSTWVIV